MNPRLLLAVLFGIGVALGVYILEVVTPPPALFLVDLIAALLAGVAVFLLAFALRL
jgi:hypothetical protein